MVGLSVEIAQPYIEKAVTANRRKIHQLSKNQSTKLAFWLFRAYAACFATAIREGLVNPRSEYFEWIESSLWQTKTRSSVFSMALQVRAWHIGFVNLSCTQETKDQRLSGYIDHLLNTQENDGSWIQPGSDSKKG